MSEEDIERFEEDMELRLWREYRDVLPMFSHVVETERRFYLANGVEQALEERARLQTEAHQVVPRQERPRIEVRLGPLP